MMKPFKAPKPMDGERHNSYLLRVVAEFEAWANAKPEKTLFVPPHKAGFTLHHNDHYANYWTAEEAITDGQGGWYSDDDNWVSLEEKAKACATNEIWTAQWYPETPIGFCLLHASTLEALNKGLSVVDSTAQP